MRPPRGGEPLSSGGTDQAAGTLSQPNTVDGVQGGAVRGSPQQAPGLEQRA